MGVQHSLFGVVFFSCQSARVSASSYQHCQFFKEDNASADVAWWSPFSQCTHALSQQRGRQLCLFGGRLLGSAKCPISMDGVVVVFEVKYSVIQSLQCCFYCKDAFRRGDAWAFNAWHLSWRRMPTDVFQHVSRKLWGWCQPVSSCSHESADILSSVKVSSIKSDSKTS